MNTSAAIALIEPPSPFFLSGFPLGLASLAAHLEKRSPFRARVLDLQACGDPETVRTMLREECVRQGIRVYGVRVVTPAYAEAKKIIALIKELDPGSTVIAGGPHVSAEPERTLAHNRGLDVVVVGEGEKTLEELLPALGDPYALARVRGIAWRSPAGAVTVNPRRPLMPDEELGNEPFEYGRFLDYGRYSGNDRSALMVTSRGCPFGCSFCSAARFWGECAYRARPVGHVIGELEYLVLRRGIERIYFEDAIFNPSKARVLEFCGAVIARRREEPRFSFTWRPPCRVDLLDGEMLEKMKEAGCTDIFFGLETFDERQLRAVKGGGIADTPSKYRGYIAKVEEVFSRCREAGIETIASLIMGLPYETEATFEVNCEMLRKIRPDKLTFNVLSLYAGAPLLGEYAREPGFEWLGGLLGREDLFEIGLEDPRAAEELNALSVHGPRALKPRYLKKEAYLERGKIEHDIEKIKSDHDRYRRRLGGLVADSLSIRRIRSITSQ